MNFQKPENFVNFRNFATFLRNFTGCGRKNHHIAARPVLYYRFHFRRQLLRNIFDLGIFRQYQIVGRLRYIQGIFVDIAELICLVAACVLVPVRCRTRRCYPV